jgi:polyhydroxybutyrate depolymerase
MRLAIAFAFAAAVAAAVAPSAAHRRLLASGEMCAPARPHASGTSVESIATADGARSYRLHVPPSYTGATPLPVVVNMHGRGSNAVEQEAYSAFSTKADSSGFIVVYPDGLTVGLNSTHWNAWQLPAPQPDDVAFIASILDRLNATLCTDQSRVYATGMSNGAMMSVRLACSLSSRVAAVAPVAGAYFPPMAYNLNPNETCPNTAPRPLIAFHGTADAAVPFNGGLAGGVNYRLPVDDATPAEDVLADWAAHNGCASPRQESQVGTEVRHVQYGACASGASVELYAVDGGGHTWPGAFDVPSLGYTTHQISATDLIWSFFANFTLPDTDGDLIPDAADNCPAAPNFPQTNSDADFLDLEPGHADDVTWPNSDAAGDACDPDDDNDGLADAAESVACASATGPTLASVRDSDGDRALDGAECAIGTDPLDAASRPTLPQCASAAGAASTGLDTDGDGLSDAIEFCYYASDPHDANTDGDLCGDGREVMSVNADRAVTAADLGLVAGAFGAYAAGPPPYPAYLVDYDVNKDGSITASDLGLVASRFGACP